MYWLALILVGMLLILIDLLTHPHTFSIFLISETEYYYEPRLEEKIREELEYDKKSQKEVSWGGFVLIGPIPLFFGSFKGSKYSKYFTPIALLLGIMFTLLAMMYIFKYYSP